MLQSVVVTRRRKRDGCDNGLVKPFVAKGDKSESVRSKTEIWQELHSTWLKKMSIEESSVQPATEEENEFSVSPTKSSMMIKSEATSTGLQWVTRLRRRPSVLGSVLEMESYYVCLRV